MFNDNENEELDQMEANRQNREAEKSGKEALKKHAKKNAKNKALKVIINAIIAKIQIVLLFVIISTMIVTIITSIIVALFGGDSNKNNSPTDDMNNNYTVLSLVDYLRQYSHSGEAPQTDDKKFYKLYGDGVGWPTIGNADLQWKSHQNKFAKAGKVLSGNTIKTVSNVQDYVNGFLTRGSTATYTNAEIDAMNVYVERALVDEIGNETAESIYQSVKNYTNGIELSQQQLYALTAVMYNFGHLPERNGHTFVTAYEEASASYPVNSWQHNRHVWDTWWNALGGGAAGHIPARDAAYETYVKGVYDFSQSDAGEVFGRKYYIYYTQEQLNQFSYAPNKSITRTTANEPTIFSYAVGKPTQHYDGECVTAAGHEFPHYLQANFSGAFGTSTIAAAGCGPTSMAMILAGLCNDYSITPVTYIAKLNEYFNNNWREYYLPGAGSIYAGICNADLLKKYYNCTARYASSAEAAYQALENGNCGVIGAEVGHVLAMIPLPDEYKNSGYKFYVMDSARGHSGPYKSTADFVSRNPRSGQVCKIYYIIELLDN